MIRILLEKIFKKDFTLLLYLAPILSVALSHLILTEYSPENSSLQTFYFIALLLSTACSIVITLHRFANALRKPYQRSNIHIMLSSIFSTITFFAFIYTVLHTFIPGSFANFAGATPWDTLVNSLYFSIITFTTVGYGDIHPVASIAKIFTSVETLSFFIFFVLLTSNHKSFFNQGEEKQAP